MLHFVTSYMKQNKSRKQTLESAQYGLEISFNANRLESTFSNSLIIHAALTQPDNLILAMQVDGFRYPMKNELKTRPCLK